MTKCLLANCLTLFAVSTALAEDQSAKLRAAAFAGDTTTVSRLASKSVVNSANEEGVTALMIAAALGHTNIVGTLLQAGAQTEATTKKEQVTALMLATLYGRLETAQLLVEKGAKVAAVDARVTTFDKKGLSAVDYAIYPGKDGVIRPNKEGKTAVAKYLLSKGAKLKLTAENFLDRLLAADIPDVIDGLLRRAMEKKP